MQFIHSVSLELDCKGVLELCAYAFSKEVLCPCGLNGHLLQIQSWDSSVSIVCDLRLDDRGSIPSRGKGFSL
jgi:hypothetical protein